METKIINPKIVNKYIFCRARGGLNDALNQLYDCTLYAIKYNYHIILEFTYYNTIKVYEIFDFKNYPVVIYPPSKLKELNILDTEPKSYYPYIFDNNYNKHCLLRITFDKNKIYSNNTLLIHDHTGGGIKGINVLQKIKFTSYFINLFYNKVKELPLKYDALHFRHTDNNHHYKDKKIDPYKLRLSLNNFIESSPYKIYIASDNKDYINYVKNKFNDKVITTKACDFIKGKYSNIHNYGLSNDFVLIDCLIDLLILANSNKLIISPVGGYSKLAGFLWSNKKILNNLLLENNSDKELLNRPFDYEYNDIDPPFFNNNKLIKPENIHFFNKKPLIKSVNVNFNKKTVIKLNKSISKLVKPIFINKLIKPVNRNFIKKPLNKINKPITKLVKPITRNQLIKSVNNNFIKKTVINLTKHVTKPLIKSVTKPVSKPLNRPVSKPLNRPVSKQVIKQVTKPVNKPVSKLVNKPVNRTATKLVNKPTNKPINKLLNRNQLFKSINIKNFNKRQLNKPITKQITKSLNRNIFNKNKLIKIIIKSKIKSKINNRNKL
jgi:hypothetical protein